MSTETKTTFWINARDQATKVLQQSDRQLNKYGLSLKKVAGIAASYFGTRAMIGFAKSSIAASNEQELAEKKLEQALRATGNAAGFTADELKKQAAQFQQMSKFGDEAIITSQSMLATFKDIKGDNFNAATQSIMNMTAAMGNEDLTSATMQIGRALNDPIAGLSALSRSGVQFSDSQKEMIKAMAEAGDMAGAQAVILAELNGQFGGQAQAQADTFGGKMKQLGNAFGDIKERIGTVITENNFFKAALDETIFLFENFGDIASMWSTKLALAVEIVKQDFMHSFTKVIPAYLSWFGDNWVRLGNDMYHNWKAMLTNIWENFKNLFTNIWSFLKGDGFNFEWTGLTEGFRRTTEKLPEILARESSSMELALAQSLANQETDLAARKAARFNQQEFKPGSAPVFAGAGDPMADPLAASGKGFTVESRFLGASASKKDETADNTRKLVELQKKQIEATKKLAEPRNLAAAGKTDKIMTGNII